MAVTINGSNTPTAGGVTYGDGTQYATTAAGTSGQVLTSAGSSAPVWASVSSGFTYGTTVTPTGTGVVTFTGIPSTAKYINVILSGISGDAGTVYYVRIGTSGGVETTSYQNATSQINASTVETNGNTTRFAIGGGTSFAAATTVNGVMQIVNLTGNTWVASGTFGVYNSGGASTTVTTGGTKTLSGVLDRIEITAGTANFDAGSINISYI
jgi:hypothetical protein